MKINSFTKVLAISFSCILITSSVVFAAPVFKDVPETHWAYASISTMAEQGIMSGDTVGNFKPNSYIDKFETSKIFARSAGYKYTNLTETEKTYYDRAYEKNKNLLANFSKNFKKWNSSANREISYLLEKEILTQQDLAQFVLKDTYDTEKLRALSREEATLFLVRLMDKKDDALAGSYTHKFKDDDSISVASKPYIYYLHSQGIIAGDAQGTFNPNGAVNRASLAVLLDKSLAVSSGNVINVAQNTTDNNYSKVETVTGTFDKYYPSLNAIQLIEKDGKKKIYKLTGSTSIYVDSFIKTSKDLKEGMSIAAVVVNNDEILDIKATTTSLPPSPTPSPTLDAKPNTTNQNTASQTPAPTSSTAPPAPPYVNNTELLNQKLFVEGIVKGKTKEQNSNTITIEVRMLNTKDEIITESRKFFITENTQITRGETSASFESIVNDDVAKIDYNGNNATNIVLEEKDRIFSGATLKEKRFIQKTNSPLLIIQGTNGKIYELRVTNESFISRRGNGQVSFTELRVGDVVDGKAQYDKLVELYAYGTISAVKGVVEEIHLTKTQPYIILINSDTKKEEKYNLISSSVDIYSFRIGDLVELRLDSKEVTSFITVSQNVSNTFTGYITGFGSNGAILAKSSTSNFASEKTISTNSNTVYTNSVTSKQIAPSNLYSGMKIYVVFSDTQSSMAKSITVISE